MEDQLQNCNWRLLSKIERMSWNEIQVFTKKTQKIMTSNSMNRKSMDIEYLHFIQI